MKKSVIKPLTLGNKSFPVNLIQGPLAGVSAAPFRLLTWQYSKPAFSCTEMISCKTLLHHSKEGVQRFIKQDEKEGPVCFQLSGTDPLELAEAIKRVTDYGADMVDLNCGCPVNKIRKKGAGSKLLTDTGKLYQLITAMKKNTHLPVSIKIRVEGSSNERFNQAVAQVVGDAGADFLIVHGRHWTEHYETPCHYEDIQFFVEALNLPVIGNGDIACQDSLMKMLKTGCAGAMVGRASVGQPWLIGKLIAEVSGEIFVMPSLGEIGGIFLEHVGYLVDLLGSEKFALLNARKFAKYYARTVDDRGGFCAEVNVCESLAELMKICSKHFNGAWV